MNSKTVSGIFQNRLQAQSVIDLLALSGIRRADIVLRDSENSDLDTSRGIGLLVFVSDPDTEERVKQILLDTGAREILAKEGNPEWSEKSIRSDFPWDESDEELRYRL